MSYYIEYNPELRAKYPAANAGKRVTPIFKVLICLIVIAMVTFSIFKFNIGYYIIPGNPKITIEAFNSMIHNVQNGSPINDAVFSFCKDIVLNESQKNEGIY